MTNTQKYVTTIFDDSAHALNVSFHIMPVILFSHLIGLNDILYMALDTMFQVIYVLIYLAVIVSNIIRTIRQALTTFFKTGTYVE